MEIYTSLEPYELAANIVDDREATSICSEILRQWNPLPQEMYEEVLGEIPDHTIKQYLRKMRQMEEDDREILLELRRERRNDSKRKDY